MSEEIPKFESPESSEVTKEEVIEAYKKGGPEDANAIQLLKQWAIQKEREVVETPTRGGVEGAQVQIRRDMEYAEIMEKAGVIEDAIGVLHMCIYQAEQIKDEKLISEIVDLLERLEVEG